jgi:hypothetical protein
MARRNGGQTETLPCATEGKQCDVCLAWDIRTDGHCGGR